MYREVASRRSLWTRPRATALIGPDCSATEVGGVLPVAGENPGGARRGRKKAAATAVAALVGARTASWRSARTPARLVVEPEGPSSQGVEAADRAGVRAGRSCRPPRRPAGSLRSSGAPAEEALPVRTGAGPCRVAGSSSSSFRASITLVVDPPRLVSSDVTRTRHPPPPAAHRVGRRRRAPRACRGSSAVGRGRAVKFGVLRLRAAVEVGETDSVNRSLGARRRWPRPPPVAAVRGAGRPSTTEHERQLGPGRRSTSSWRPSSSVRPPDRGAVRRCEGSRGEALRAGDGADQ